jgi:L-ascorbate metabolism protein UlaG (beta-lactamase superfamily)
MRIRKFGHACLLVEHADARLLLDPGIFAPGFEELTGLTGVLVTHQHTDHLDQDRLPALLEHNPTAVLHADEATAGQLADKGYQTRVVRQGDVLDLGTQVRVFGRDHAMVHPDVPVIPNVGYLVAERLYHPGDSFTRPDVDVEILGLPTAAPWMKAAEAVDYLRAVHPQVAVPIHEALLTRPELHYGLFEALAPTGTQVRVIDAGEPLDL